MLPHPKALLAPKYPFRNLVFQGGGVKAYAYHGVLRVLEEDGVLAQIERVAGTSAGALQAAMLCFRLSAEETIRLYKTVDYAKIRAAQDEKETESRARRLLNKPLSPVRQANRLARHFGLYSTTYMKTWLDETIARYCDGNGRATFADFRAHGFRELYTVAANISRRQVEVFSADTTPQVAVADAVLMSAAVPFFFEAQQFDGHALGQGDFYIDGGALSNYPLNLFDDPKFKTDNRNFTYGVNWETLGCQLFTPPGGEQRRAEIGNIIQFAENVFGTMGNTQNVAVEMRAVDRWRSMRISNCGVSTVDFDIQPDEGDPRYVEMVNAGEQAAREYLKAYTLPTDRFAGIKEKFSEFIEMLR